MRKRGILGVVGCMILSGLLSAALDSWITELGEPDPAVTPDGDGAFQLGMRLCGFCGNRYIGSISG